MTKQRLAECRQLGEKFRQADQSDPVHGIGVVIGELVAALEEQAQCRAVLEEMAHPDAWTPREAQ